MSESAPHFELRRQYDDGSESEPMLFPLHELANVFVGSRRGFLAAGVGAGLALGTLPMRAKGAVAAHALQPRAHRGPIVGLSISAKGDYLATASGEDFKVWSLTDKRIVFEQASAGDAWQAIAIAGGLIVAGHNSGHLQLFKGLGAPEAIGDTTFAGGLTTLALNWDGSVLYAGGPYGIIERFELPSLKSLGKQAQSAAITSLKCSHDGVWLASGDRNGGIKLWSRKDHALLADLAKHTAPVSHLAFKADGSHLMSRSDDRTIRLWDLPGGALFKTLQDHWAQAETMTLSPNGKFLITSTRTTLNVWRIANGENLASLTGHRAPITSVAISRDNTWAVSGDEGGIVIIWDLKERRPRSFLFDPSASNTSMVGTTFTVTDDATSTTVTYTLPCGSAIPAGAICTCNCVPGSLELVRVPVPVDPTEAQLRRQDELERKRLEAEERKQEAEARREQLRWEREERRRQRYGPKYDPPAMGGGGGGTLVCTCDLIYICHASKLLDADQDIALLAAKLIQTGGHSALAYLTWARRVFDGTLRQQIDRCLIDLRIGQSETRLRWPKLRKCYDLLNSADEVVATMAAQALALRSRDRRVEWPLDRRRRVSALLQAAAQRPWQVRYS
jgi:hypothetical protein